MHLSVSAGSEEYCDVGWGYIGVWGWSQLDERGDVNEASPRNLRADCGGGPRPRARDPTVTPVCCLRVFKYRDINLKFNQI